MDKDATKNLLKDYKCEDCVFRKTNFPFSSNGIKCFTNQGPCEQFAKDIKITVNSPITFWIEETIKAEVNNSSSVVIKLDQINIESTYNVSVGSYNLTSFCEYGIKDECGNYPPLELLTILVPIIMNSIKFKKAIIEGVITIELERD